MDRRFLDQVVEIERRSFSDPWAPAAFESELTHPWAWFQVAGPERPDGIPDPLEAFILCYLLPGDMHVINVAVDPLARKHGLGKKLLRYALDTFSSRGGGVVGLEVRVSNLAAQKMYNSFGFVTVGKRPGYYRKENEDALVMILQVPPLAAAGGQR
jgi:ribosomal-protein-alanine N-acetyltransferase